MFWEMVSNEVTIGHDKFECLEIPDRGISKLKPNASGSRKHMPGLPRDATTDPRMSELHIAHSKWHTPSSTLAAETNPQKSDQHVVEAFGACQLCPKAVYLS